MELKPGAKLGPYEILSVLGTGGMGQVWKARDTRLDRIVAIKTSDERFSERFDREARTIAALNHPHICALYDVGPDYLVMEYIDGAEIKGPFALDQALKYAIQIATALGAAHRKLITHRDLKPANILVTKSGVKVLDFGLAKIEKAEEAVANDETPTRPLTQEGSIVGTPWYMAPEQLQGRLSDARADIFSFGCVLYEMLTGRRAFDGENIASVIAAIIERPAPSAGDVAPASLDRLVKRCLAKDPEDRYQSALDIRADLEWIAAESVAQSQDVQSRDEGSHARSSKLAWVVAATLAVAGTTLAFVHFSEKPPATAVTRFTISPPVNTSFRPFGQTPTLPALSPDGRKLVFQAVSSDGKGQLWIRSLDAVAAQPLVGTEEGYLPFWSPDGKSIGFVADGKLKRIEVDGGPALTLTEIGFGNEFAGSWSSEGTIVFTRVGTGPLLQIPASGGAVTDATRTDSAKETAHGAPWFLPDGKSFLFISRAVGGALTIRVGRLRSLDGKEAGDTRILAETDLARVVYASGYLLFVRGGTLMAQLFDTGRLATTGDAFPVAEQIQGANFSASLDGTLVYASGPAPQSQLAWFERSGKRLANVGEPASMTRLNFSPDRRNAVVSASGMFWIYDVARGLRTRFNFGASNGYDAVWSPDGSTIVFEAEAGGSLYRKASDGTGAEELLYKDNLEKDPISFSPDGKLLAYDAAGDPKTHRDIWILPNPLGPAGSSKPYPFIRTEANEANPQISPDGKWIAWQSDESGRFEIYAASFPALGGKRFISIKGGTRPRWRRDGDEIFYLATTGNLLTATAVKAKGGVLGVGETRTVLSQQMSGYGWDVSADGQKILALVPSDPAGAPPLLAVVLNWPAGLKK
jgi:serine/threonine protein kinase/Tol biopolymer transport system component